MNGRCEKILKISLIALILMTLAFIFGNSLLSKEASGEESEAVSGFLEKIFPPTTAFGSFLSENIRKIAHFVEFFTLGAELGLYSCLFLNDKKRGIASGALLCFFVAFFDESLQILSERGAQIKDVWLDFFGSATALILCSVFAYFVSQIKSNKERRGTDG
jgi:VanZ family protein